MPDLFPDDLQARATYRRRDSACGLGAALGGELTEPERGGRLWECVVTDTINGFRWIEVLAPRVPHDVEIEPEEIEELVERKACSLPRETRLDDLVELSPLRVER